MLSGTFGARGLKVDRPISIFVLKKSRSFGRGTINLSVDGGILPPSLEVSKIIRYTQTDRKTDKKTDRRTVTFK